MSTIKLPSPPVPMHGFFTALHKGYIVPITDTDLRARDLEIARVVLDAAAKTADRYAHVPSLVSDKIRALEFHHE